MVKLKLKPPKDKPNAAPKFATAVLLFKRVEAAFGAVGASGREDRNLKDVQVDWIGGEPEYIKKLREKGALESGKSSGASGKADNPPKSTPFASSLFSRLAGRTPLSGGTFDSFPDLVSTRLYGFILLQVTDISHRTEPILLIINQKQARQLLLRRNL